MIRQMPNDIAEIAGDMVVIEEFIWHAENGRPANYETRTYIQFKDNKVWSMILSGSGGRLGKVVNTLEG